MKRLSIFIILIWWAVVGASLLWNVLNTRREHEQLVLQTARSMFQHIVLTRSWNARHGGVYVPVTAETPPNPHLDPAQRDIAVNDRLTLTKVNPAYMTRQIAEIAADHDGIQFHITSLKPIRPANRPTELEREVLERFERGAQEYSRFLSDGDSEAFFYMAPLTTTKACLKCHEKQGYEIGDVRGGISVTFPNTRPAQVWGMVGGHVLIAVIGTLLIVVFMRRLMSAYEAMRRQSIMDALTGIANRRYFTERLLQEFRRARRDKTPLSLIICDIDYFKKYNDAYGHPQGDECLTRVARTIEGALQRAGDLCARYGGEEFVIVLPNTATSGGWYLAERIRAAVENLKVPHSPSPISDYVTLSIGLATELDGYESHETLIKRADEALYRAKEGGRNRICSVSRQGLGW